MQSQNKGTRVFSFKKFLTSADFIEENKFFVRALEMAVRLDLIVFLTSGP